MGRLRTLVKKLKRDARGDLESFELLDGSTYVYDPIETGKAMFMHAYDCRLGDALKWEEPPEIYSKIAEARDPRAVLKRFKPDPPVGAFVDVTQIYEEDVLVNERRLLLVDQEPVEDLSQP